MNIFSVPDVGLIVCAIRDKAGTITRLGVIRVLGDETPLYFEKAEVVDAVVKGAELKVVWRDPGGPERLGPRVHAVGGKYLTTDPSSTTKDNLGNVPEC